MELHSKKKKKKDRLFTCYYYVEKKITVCFPFILIIHQEYYVKNLNCFKGIFYCMKAKQLYSFNHSLNQRYPLQITSMQPKYIVSILLLTTTVCITLHRLASGYI